LSKKGEWQLNSGDRLKGTNVIDQQVDQKKRVSLSISQLLPPPLFNGRLSNTHTVLNLPLLFVQTTSAVQIYDVRIKILHFLITPPFELPLYFRQGIVTTCRRTCFVTLQERITI
jgi:hypothetical protein